MSPSRPTIENTVTAADTEQTMLGQIILWANEWYPINDLPGQS